MCMKLILMVPYSLGLIDDGYLSWFWERRKEIPKSRTKTTRMAMKICHLVEHGGDGGCAGSTRKDVCVLLPRNRTKRQEWR